MPSSPIRVDRKDRDQNSANTCGILPLKLRCSSSPHLFYSGWDKRSDNKPEWFQLFQIGFGGIPGRPLGDGPDGHSLWPGFTNVPNEFLERYFPLRIERYSTEPDSGGAGLHRGGNGIRMTYRFLADGQIAVHDDRWFVPPWGVNGGHPGLRAKKLLERKDGTTEIVGNKVEDVSVQAGDLLRMLPGEAVVGSART